MPCFEHVQESTQRKTLQPLTDDELLRRAAHEALKVVYVVDRAMMMKVMLAVTTPVEAGILTLADTAKRVGDV
jgi:hypothetical protein